METIGYFAARFLEPVERFRGKNDVRFYLNGVMIEPHPQGGVTIAATDGHRLMMARDPNGYVDKQRIFRVPTPILSASKRKGAGRFYLLEGMCVVMNNSMEEVEPTDNPLLPEYDSTIGKVTHIDGKFPDVRKAIGDVDKRIKTAGGSWFGINAEYLSSISGAFDQMTDPRGKYNGTQVLPPEKAEDVILFLPGNETVQAICGIMPMGCNKMPEASTGWLEQPKEAEGEKKAAA